MKTLARLCATHSTNICDPLNTQHYDGAWLRLFLSLNFSQFFFSSFCLKISNLGLWSIFGHEIEPNPRQNTNKRKTIDWKIIQVWLALPVVLLSHAHRSPCTPCVCLSSVLRFGTKAFDVHNVALLSSSSSSSSSSNTQQQTSSSSFQWIHGFHIIFHSTAFDRVLRRYPHPIVYDCVK